MPSRGRPTAEDGAHAASMALSGIAEGRKLDDLAVELHSLHPRNNTFPGEVLLGLAADTLLVAGVTRDDPLDAEGLHERFLPEDPLIGRAHQKSRYTLHAAAALHGGVNPDLLDEVAWWRSDDFWYHALLVLIVYMRASAEKSGRTVTDLCRRIADLRGIDLRG